MTAGTPETGGGAAPPLRAVLAAFEQGCRTLGEIAQVSGQDRDVVDAAVQHLVRSGWIEARSLQSGCPSGGCGSCASSVQAPEGDYRPGCGADGPSDRRRGPALVTLTLRRRPGAP